MDLNYDAFDNHYSFAQAHVCNQQNFRTYMQNMPKFIKMNWLLLGFFILPLYLIFFSLSIVSLLLIFQESNYNLASVGLRVISAIVLATIAFIGIITYKNAGVRALRLRQFCNDNNLKLTPFFTSIGQEEGTVFGIGHSHVAKNGINGEVNGNQFVLFEYQYTVGYGKNSRTHRLGVTKIKLNKKFPHIILDSKQDSSISIGVFSFDRSQRLELEGDFNNFFNIYGPKEYEIEVLQILNPSVMQSLLSINEPMDIEIIGKYLYIYNSGALRNKQTFQAIFNAISQITSSTKNVQKTFSMPNQIGDHKPVLKRSKMSIVVTIFIIIVLLAVQILL